MAWQAYGPRSLRPSFAAADQVSMPPPPTEDTTDERAYTRVVIRTNETQGPYMSTTGDHNTDPREKDKQQERIVVGDP
jgi:hypothetical protein